MPWLGVLSAPLRTRRRSQIGSQRCRELAVAPKTPGGWPERDLDVTGGALRLRGRPELRRASAFSERDRTGVPGARHPRRWSTHARTVGSSADAWIAHTGPTGLRSLSNPALVAIGTVARNVGVSGACRAAARPAQADWDRREPIRRIDVASAEVSLRPSTPRRRPHRPDARGAVEDGPRGRAHTSRCRLAHGMALGPLHPAELADRTVSARSWLAWGALVVQILSLAGSWCRPPPPSPFGSLVRLWERASSASSVSTRRSSGPAGDSQDTALCGRVLPPRHAHCSTVER